MLPLRYIVVSLPRTGTRSICQMAEIVGFMQKHVSINWQADLLRYEFFSDTPYFAPSVVRELAASSGFDTRFIYLDRKFDDWYSSFKQVGLLANFSGFLSAGEDSLSPTQKFDKHYYSDALGPVPIDSPSVAENAYVQHRLTVHDILRSNHRPLLVYSFSDGWEPFCHFVGKPVPNHPLPHLNKSRVSP